jgi:hypothetical protein
MQAVSVPAPAWCAAPAVLLLCLENQEVRFSVPPVPHSSPAFVFLPCCELFFQLLNLLESVCKKKEKSILME